ncbi:MAG: deoxyribodipyrimidine photolyase, partial [Frankiales bacterium]|nr:deoxyribodipyrimidine photolyase [Frankiales bacterium]
MPVLPPPPSGDAAVAWVAEHLGDLSGDAVRASTSVRGGQAAADAALAALDLTGYARKRSQVLPASARGASQLSPYVRHGLLTLPQVWDAAGSAPPGDRDKYRDELLWQEYARH